MNNHTDDLLSELDNLRRGEETPPSSQADHLLNALKSANGLSEEAPSAPDASDHASSSDHDLDEMDDLLEFMNDDFEEGSEQEIQTPDDSSEYTPEPISQPETTESSSQTPPLDATTHSQQKIATHSSSQTEVSSVESAALALEAAKAAQEAAENSQKATEMAIKNAHELKAEVVELSDSNYAWRQAVKNANKEIKSAKNMVSILATISIIFSFAAAGIMGYYLYSLNKKYEQLKGEVLDIIQTESTLFQKKFNTKVDELSSLIEFLNSKVDKLSKNSPQTTHITPVTIHSSEQAEETPPSSKQMTVQYHTQTAHKHTITEKVSVQNQPNQHATESYSTHINPKALEELNQIVQKILHKQQALESLIQQTLHATQQNAHRPTIIPDHTQTVMAKLSPEDEKKLAAIRWLIKVQNKKIKAIQHALKKGTKQEKRSEYMQLQTTLKAIQQQVQNLQNQQNELKSEVQSLKEETQKLSIHRPYYYRAPKDEM